MCCSLNSFRKAFTCPVFYALLNYYFAAEVQLIIVSYWTGSRIFFNDALEHNEWCGRMLASLTSHVFARGHVLPYYVIRSLGSLMVACLVTTLLYAALNSLVAWVLMRVYSWVRWELDDEAWAFCFRGWLLLKISVTDFSASLAIDISFVRNSRTPNVTQICVSSEGMNEWFEAWAQRWWAVAQHESLSSNI